ncbi:MAG TPA: tetratricopeptide repeat protein, partial [Firmicutes bacterium]|nr:tetratricopeptide repeat protein [Bacillota bacterium]
EIYHVKYGIAYERAARKAEKPAAKKEKLEKAVEIHKGSLKINEKNGYNFNNIARTYKLYGDTLDRNMYRNAIVYYEEAIKRDPNNAYFALDLAGVYINLGEFDAAEQICAHFTEVYPGFAVSFSYLGYIYMLRWQNALRENPEKAGEYLEKSGHYYEQAIDNKQWFRDDSSMMSTYSNLGIISFNRGDPEKAVSYFNEIKEKRPGYKEAYLNLAMIYVRMNMIDEAIEEYREVLKMDPNDRRASEPLKELMERR